MVVNFGKENGKLKVMFDYVMPTQFDILWFMYETAAFKHVTHIEVYRMDADENRQGTKPMPRKMIPQKPFDAGKATAIDVGDILMKDKRYFVPMESSPDYAAIIRIAFYWPQPKDDTLLQAESDKAQAMTRMSGYVPFKRRAPLERNVMGPFGGKTNVFA